MARPFSELAPPTSELIDQGRAVAGALRQMDTTGTTADIVDHLCNRLEAFDGLVGQLSAHPRESEEK